MRETVLFSISSVRWRSVTLKPSAARARRASTASDRLIAVIGACSSPRWTSPIEPSSARLEDSSGSINYRFLFLLGNSRLCRRQPVCQAPTARLGYAGAQLVSGRHPTRGHGAGSPTWQSRPPGHRTPVDTTHRIAIMLLLATLLRKVRRFRGVVLPMARAPAF